MPDGVSGLGRARMCPFWRSLHRSSSSTHMLARMAQPGSADGEPVEQLRPLRLGDVSSDGHGAAAPGSGRGEVSGLVTRPGKPPRPQPVRGRDRRRGPGRASTTGREIRRCGSRLDPVAAKVSESNPTTSNAAPTTARARSNRPRSVMRPSSSAQPVDGPEQTRGAWRMTATPSHGGAFVLLMCHSRRDGQAQPPRMTSRPRLFKDSSWTTPAL
jgi:hypothetical protein